MNNTNTTPVSNYNSYQYVKNRKNTIPFSRIIDKYISLFGDIRGKNEIVINRIIRFANDSDHSVTIIEDAETYFTINNNYDVFLHYGDGTSEKINPFKYKISGFDFGGSKIDVYVLPL